MFLTLKCTGNSKKKSAFIPPLILLNLMMPAFLGSCAQVQYYALLYLLFLH